MDVVGCWLLWGEKAYILRFPIIDLQLNGIQGTEKGAVDQRLMKIEKKNEVVQHDSKDEEIRLKIYSKVLAFFAAQKWSGHHDCLIINTKGYKRAKTPEILNSRHIKYIIDGKEKFFIFRAQRAEGDLGACPHKKRGKNG